MSTTDISPAWSADLLPDLTTPLARLVLAVADDELVTGHRTSHWTGVAPSLEADMAFSTIAQDEINHADVLYSLLVDRDADDARRRIDALGLGRTPDQYRHALLCERPPGDFTYSLARQWAYDHADVVRLGALAESSHGDLAGVAKKLLREERYHLLHADTWFDQLVGRTSPGGGGRGGPRREERRRAPASELLARERSERGVEEYGGALARVLPEALWLFEPIEGEDEVVAAGLLPTPSVELRGRWLEGITAALESADLADVLPDDLEPSYDQPGGRHGHHSDDFNLDVWPEMTALHRDHPGADW